MSDLKVFLGATTLTSCDINVTFKKIMHGATICPLFWYAVGMKVKKENIKINNGIYNVVPSSFKFAQEIWESESLIDDLDFHIPVDFIYTGKRGRKYVRTRK